MEKKINILLILVILSIVLQLLVLRSSISGMESEAGGIITSGPRPPACVRWRYTWLLQRVCVEYVSHTSEMGG